MAVTKLQDVQNRLNRPLEGQETTLAETLIDDVERMIKRQAPENNLDNLDDEALVSVTATAVARVLKNPEGYRSEQVGGVGYSLDTRAAAGFILITSDEWRMLGLANPNGTAGYVAPTIGHDSVVTTDYFWTDNPYMRDLF